MATTHQREKLIRVAACAALAGAFAVLSTGSAAGTPSGATYRLAAATRAAVESARPQPPRRGLYGWPVKPFDRQHPVRGFFNDPRIGRHGGHSFHFGVDIAAPDGTPVYAVAPGRAHLSSRRTVSVVAPGGSVVFGYWHIDPVVKHRQRVRIHQLLGYVHRNEGHVHLAEFRGKHYVNPLRAGALTPYVDPTPPTVRSIELIEGDDGFEIQADAFDTTWPSVGGEWANLPVTPVLLEWREIASDGTIGRWRTGVDFRWRKIDRGRFSDVYDVRTRQNHRRSPGVYVFRIARGWRPAATTSAIEVRARDTRGNAASLQVSLVEHG